MFTYVTISYVFYRCQRSILLKSFVIVVIKLRLIQIGATSIDFVACPFYLDEGFGCTYIRWLAPKGTKSLENEKQEHKDEVLNRKRLIDDIEHRKEETERIMRKLKK